MQLGARDEARRETAVEKLRAAGVDAFGVPPDVTGDRSVTDAAELIERQAGRLDVLVNNAGISGEMDPGWVQDPTTLDLDVFRTVVETDVIGVIRVTNAMLPLLRRSTSPRIVNVSSSVASLTRQADPDIEIGPVMAAYSPSKSFLNAVTVQYARQFADTDILINAHHDRKPGVARRDRGCRGRRHGAGRHGAGRRGRPGGYFGGLSLRKYVQLVSFGSLHSSGARANSGWWSAM